MTKDQQFSALGGTDGRKTFAPSLRDDAPIRQAARLVIEVMGARAGKYAVWRAVALERHATWREPQLGGALRLLSKR
jgi:hypothetical protein